MPTSRPAPERKVNISGWTIEELENEKGYHIITPEGYVFGLASKALVLEFISDISFGGHVHRTMYGDSHEVRDGKIKAWYPDPWINPGIENGEDITLVSRFTDVVMRYVIAEWIK